MFDRLILTVENRGVPLRPLALKLENGIQKRVEPLWLDESLNVGLRNSFRPFGVTVDDNDIYIASNSEIFVNSGSEYSLNNSINTHQIAKYGNWLIYTNTGNDLVCWHDLTDNKTKRYLDVKTMEFTDEPNIFGTWNENDEWHVNSLCVDGEYLLITLHGGGKKSKYYALDLVTEEIELLFEDGFASHSAEVDDTYVYGLSTATGELMCFNKSSTELTKFKIVNPEKHFMRGLVVKDDCLIIGLTNLNKLDSSILAIDKETKEPIDRFFIKGFDAILDIREF